MASTHDDTITVFAVKKQDQEEKQKSRKYIMEMTDQSAGSEIVGPKLNLIKYKPKIQTVKVFHVEFWVCISFSRPDKVGACAACMSDLHKTLIQINMQELVVERNIKYT